MEDLPAALPGKRDIDVADRGADLFEFLYNERRLGRASPRRADATGDRSG